MRKFSAILLLGAFAALAVPSRADDGTAEMGVGGLTFGKSADIRMAKEDLYISPEKVRIRFAFSNDGKDQDVTIAFPLPDIDLENLQGDLGTIGKDPVNFVGFTTRVDGKPVAIQVEQKAMLKGQDRTALVRAAGLPLNLVVNDGISLLQKLPADKKAALRAAGLIDSDADYPAPLWTVQTRFYWTQHFAAGQTISIEHSYTPVTGGMQYSQGDSGAPDPDLAKLYCIDPPMAKFLKAMSDNPKLRAPDENNSPGGLLFGSVTDYILWSANTWKGPIGHFHLTLDKLDARSALTLCWKGDLKKTGATTFEFDADNFSPKQDIKMLVLR